jgi:hypothetical protein
MEQERNGSDGMRRDETDAFGRGLILFHPDSSCSPLFQLDQPQQLVSFNSSNLPDERRHEQREHVRLQ